MDNTTQREEKVKVAIEVAIELGLLALLLLISYLIAKPFMDIIVWGIIIAVALSPVINSLEKRFGNRKKVIIGFTITLIIALMVPTYMLSDTTFKESQALIQALKDGNVTINPPSEQVKNWPIVGENVYTLWDSASQNLQETLEPFNEQIKKMAGSILSVFLSGLVTVLMFIGSFIIAAALLIGRDESTKFYHNLLRRIVGDKGDEWAELTTLTIRSIVTGVIGVAVVQAIFALIGMVLMGVPFAVFLSIGIMFLTIIQVPALLIIGPVIVYVFSQGYGTAETVFTVYMLIVGASDAVLKPIFMGRGVDIPMLIVIIGAIGGMILMGMIGLFIGAVVFALAYKLFGLWIAEAEEPKEEEVNQ